MMVLAQITVDDLRESATRYQSDSGQRFFIFAIIFLTIFVTLALIWRFVHYGKIRRRPLLLFHGLSDFHDIPKKTRRRLLQLARVHGVSDPACLFVCPELLKHIKSLEVAESRNDKERQRLDEFFSGFSLLAYGDKQSSIEP